MSSHKLGTLGIVTFMKYHCLSGFKESDENPNYGLAALTCCQISMHETRSIENQNYSGREVAGCIQRVMNILEENIGTSVVATNTRQGQQCRLALLEDKDSLCFVRDERTQGAVNHTRVGSIDSNRPALTVTVRVDPFELMELADKFTCQIPIDSVGLL